MLGIKQTQVFNNATCQTGQSVTSQKFYNPGTAGMVFLLRFLAAPTTGRITAVTLYEYVSGSTDAVTVASLTVSWGITGQLYRASFDPAMASVAAKHVQCVAPYYFAFGLTSPLEAELEILNFSAWVNFIP